MTILRRYLIPFLSGAFLALCLASCGGSPWRYSPEAASTPTGLTATAGNGQVALAWTAAANAAAYDVYYATSPGAGTGGTKIAALTGTSTFVTGLTNGVTYYFTVAAVNSVGESPLSGEVSATPAAPIPYTQGDLQGTWYFNVLATGGSAGWMRGIAAIDASGTVSVTSFLDRAGNTTAPVGLFTAMSIQSDGTVSQGAPATDFHGVLSANQYRDMLVGTGSLGSSRLLIVLQKRVSGVAYGAADIRGTGRLVAGPLSFVYHQLASGTSAEWEYAAGQIGQDQEEEYTAINGPTPRQLPGGGSKVVSVAITPDGIVTETPVPGVSPQPTLLLTWGVMSADKMTIVGTGTDSSGASVLRVLQFVHPPSVSLTASTYTLEALAGTYGTLRLAGGTAPLWGDGTLGVDASGNAAYTAFLDSSGSTALPPATVLSVDQQGGLTEPAAPSFHGQLSYFGDLFVATDTAAPGEYGLTVSLRR